MAMEQNLGTYTSFAGVSNLNSLPTNQAKPFGRVDFSSNEYPNAKFTIGIDFSGVSPMDGGSIDIYVCFSMDGTDFSGDIDLTSTTDVKSSIRNHLPRLKSLDVDIAMSDSSLVWVCNDMASLVGDLTEYWSLVIWNKSGCTLPSSGHYCKYKSSTYEN